MGRPLPIEEDLRIYLTKLVRHKTVCGKQLTYRFSLGTCLVFPHEICEIIETIPCSSREQVRLTINAIIHSLLGKAVHFLSRR